MRNSTLRKVLVIRFSSIGDIVLTSPVVRCVHMQTAAEIHFLTKPAFAGLLEHNPYITRVHTLNKGSEGLLAALRKERFDLIMDLHKNMRSMRILLQLGRPFVQFDKLNTEKWLLTALGIDRLPSKHLVDRYFEAMAPLGVHNDGAGLDVFIPKEDQLCPTQWLGRSIVPYAVVVLGAAHATKQMPYELLLAILRGIEGPVFLLGGPAEATLGERLVADLHRQDVFALAGALRVLQSASIISQSAVVLTPDTGMMHMAAAFQKPIVSVWGSTTPRFGMYPYYAFETPSLETRFEVTGLGCRPCSKIGHPTCPKGHFKCMQDQPPEAIAAAVNRPLQRAKVVL
jgi:ADP-heptose:LPS heptosyltransferase